MFKLDFTEVFSKSAVIFSKAFRLCWENIEHLTMLET